MPSILISVRLALATVLLATITAHAAEPSSCLVVGVTDGDTITACCGNLGAYEQIRVWLAAIDAPEKEQPFGTTRQGGDVGARVR